MTQNSTKVRPEHLLDDDVGTFSMYRKKTPIIAKQINEPFEVDTLEGTMKGNSGDYLAMGSQGEFYPIKQEIFLETYELVKADSSTLCPECKAPRTQDMNEMGTVCPTCHWSPLTGRKLGR